MHDIWKSNINECSPNPFLQAKWVHKPTHPTNVWIKTSLGTLWVIRTKGFFINHRDLSRWLTKSRGPNSPIMCQERYLYILHNKAMYLLYKFCINNKLDGNALTCLNMSWVINRPRSVMEYYSPGSISCFSSIKQPNEVKMCFNYYFLFI